MFFKNFEKNDANEYRTVEVLYYDRAVINNQLNGMRPYIRSEYKEKAILAAQGNEKAERFIFAWLKRNKITVNEGSKKVTAISIYEVYQIMAAN